MSYRTPVTIVFVGWKPLIIERMCHGVQQKTNAPSMIVIVRRALRARFSVLLCSACAFCFFARFRDMRDWRNIARSELFLVPASDSSFPKTGVPVGERQTSLGFANAQTVVPPLTSTLRAAAGGETPCPLSRHSRSSITRLLRLLPLLLSPLPGEGVLRFQTGDITLGHNPSSSVECLDLTLS